MSNYNPWLSATQIGMFLRCPRQWAFRYIERLIIPPSGAMKQSGSFHKTAEKNYLQKVETRRDLSPSELRDFFAAEFETSWASEEVRLQEGENKDALKDEGVKIVATYQRRIAPLVQPIEVEKKFDLNLGKDDYGFRLLGVIDVVDETGAIRDNKAMSSKRVPNQADMDRDLQLSTYSLARRLQTKQVEPALFIDGIIKYKEAPEARTFTTKRSREGLKMHLNTIGNIAKAIRADAFPRNPTGWWCSEKWCGYWSRCMGRGLVTVDQGENLQHDLEESVRAEESKTKKGRGEKEVQEEVFEKGTDEV